MEIKNFKGEIKKNEPLSRHTSYGIGGPADILACPVDVLARVHVGTDVIARCRGLVVALAAVNVHGVRTSVLAVAVCRVRSC